MYGSDFPYFEPESVIGYVRKATPKKQQDGVLAGNFAALVGLDV